MGSIPETYNDDKIGQSYVRNNYPAVHCSSLPPEYEDLLDCTPSKPGVIQASGPAQVCWDSL